MIKQVMGEFPPADLGQKFVLASTGRLIVGTKHCVANFSRAHVAPCEIGGEARSGVELWDVSAMAVLFGEFTSQAGKKLSGAPCRCVPVMI
tara:strand:+ start:598 stop:870 length:273 start_codon:yes stop_codon:yes gene_type:complete